MRRQSTTLQTGLSAWLMAAGLVAVVAAVYANALGNDFVYDDFLLIVDNPRVRVPLGYGWTQLVYRPLRLLSYRVDYAIGGMDPWIFHLSNIAYHAVTVLLVRLALRALGASPWAAMAGALVFAVHPVQTDAVTYAAGRRDVLCGLFFVAGFVTFLRARARDSWRLLALAGGAWGLALLSKEMAATLPVVCVLAHRFETRREAAGAPRASSGVAWQRAVVSFVVFALVAVGVASVTTYGKFVRGVLANTPWHGGSMGANFATVARIWVHYLGLGLWPARLSADYSANAFPVSASMADPAALASVALLALLAVGASWRWRGGGLAGLGLAWCAVTLLPVSHIVPYVELLAEHYLYVPLVGIALVVADAVGALEACCRSSRWTVVTVIVLVTAVLGARSVVRNRDWHDGLTLWTATVAVVPDCARARFNLGQAMLRKGRIDDAERIWRQAADEFPHSYPYPFALAKLSYRAGETEKAYWYVKRALRLRPRDPKTTVLAGWISLHGGNPRRALALFDAALESLPLAEAGQAAVGRARAQDALDAQAKLQGRGRP